MALWIELLMSGALPIAFALWQIRDVRREQQRRREQLRSEQQAGERQPVEQQPAEQQPAVRQRGDRDPPLSPQ